MSCIHISNHNSFVWPFRKPESHPHALIHHRPNEISAFYEMLIDHSNNTIEDTNPSREKLKFITLGGLICRVQHSLRVLFTEIRAADALPSTCVFSGVQHFNRLEAAGNPQLMLQHISAFCPGNLLVIINEASICFLQPGRKSCGHASGTSTGARSHLVARGPQIRA